MSTEFVIDAYVTVPDDLSGVGFDLVKEFTWIGPVLHVQSK